MTQQNLFEIAPDPSTRPPRAPRRKFVMHVFDAGEGVEDGFPVIAKFVCKRCGHHSEWMSCKNVTEAKKGIPCPVCNGTETPTEEQGS